MASDAEPLPGDDATAEETRESKRSFVREIICGQSLPSARPATGNPRMRYAKANPDEIDPDAWYNLNSIAKIFDCRLDTLKLEIKNDRLKANKRGRTWIVLGKHVWAWWNQLEAKHPRRRELERRFAARVSSNFSVTMKIPPDAEGNLRTPLSGQCNNVSQGGALVLLPERVDSGSRVTLVFAPAADDAATETSPIEIAATVVWTLENQEGPLWFQHGLRFLHPEIDLVMRAWRRRTPPD